MQEEEKVVTRILIADDHPLIRRGLRALLESQPGWTVVAEAKDGYEAIDAAQRTSPDIVIMDDAMPRMNGLELQSRLRDKGLAPPIIFITAYPEERARARALEAGAICYLDKPFDSATLIECLDLALRREDNKVTK